MHLRRSGFRLEQPSNSPPISLRNSTADLAGRGLRSLGLAVFGLVLVILAVVPAMASPPLPESVVAPADRAEPAAARTRSRQKAKPVLADPMKPSVHSMDVAIVRSNEPGCEPNCPEWLSADGTIDQNSPHRLKKALARLGGRKLPLFINSPGGSVDDAIAMAAIIRAKGLDVVVARTDLQPCGNHDTHCLALKAKAIRLGSPAGLARCASSCPFALAGGVRRMVGAGAYVGVHRAATYRVMTRVLRTYKVVPRYEWGIPVGTARKLVSEKPVSQSVKPVETSKETYDKIEANFVSMGVSREIMKPMLATSNNEMRWLSAAEIGDLNLVTERLNGQQVVERARVKPREAPAIETGKRTGHRTEALSPPVAMPPVSMPLEAPAPKAQHAPAADSDAAPGAGGPFSFGLPITVAPGAAR